MNNFSKTQKTNWLALAGIVVILMRYIGIDIAESDVQVVIGAIIAIIGVISNYIHRYNKGGVNKLGQRV